MLNYRNCPMQTGGMARMTVGIRAYYYHSPTMERFIQGAHAHAPYGAGSSLITAANGRSLARSLAEHVKQVSFSRP